MDLPEVSLVAILDADKQGFLRSETSLIQTIGRSARNVDAKVILYGDKVTEAMKNAIQETERRRTLQMAYNKKHNITPKTIIKPIKDDIGADLRNHREANQALENENTVYITEELIEELQTEMLKAAEALEFERAGHLRDRIGQLKDAIGKPLNSVEGTEPKSGGKGSRRKGRRASKRRGSKVPRPKRQG